MTAHFERFVGVLKLQEFPRRLWQLEETLRFYSEMLGHWIEVPAGFITDGNSTPRLPIVYLLAGDRAQEACYVHDWLYSTQVLPRHDADEVLREAVIAMGYGPDVADPMYAAVRQFGESHWNLPNVTQPPFIQPLMSPEISA